MRILRLEVFEKDNKLVFVREKPLLAKTEKGIRATHTRLINWAYQNFPEWTEVSVHPFEKK
jgi:hypothetical protein